MSKKLNELKTVESPEYKKPKSKRTTTSSSPIKVPLPPLAKRQAKVDWTEVMKLRQTHNERLDSDSSTFYYEKAFESPERATHTRFYSKNSTEFTKTSLASPTSLSRKNRAKMNESANLTMNATISNPSPMKLAFDLSLIDRIDDYERTLFEDAGKSESTDKIKRELQGWTEFYSDLDLVSNSQERAVAARRIAHNSQKMISRLLSLHDQHTKRCTSYIESMKETILGLKREVVLALRLKEALVVNSMDKERIEREIEDMYENGDDFNYANFTTSARRLLDKGESQLTYYLMEAYKELCKDRQFPSVENPDINVSSMARWESEMKLKFM